MILEALLPMCAPILSLFAQSRRSEHRYTMAFIYKADPSRSAIRAVHPAACLPSKRDHGDNGHDMIHEAAEWAPSLCQGTRSQGNLYLL